MKMYFATGCLTVTNRDTKKILLSGVEGRMLNGFFAESAALALLHF
jgi:hypothetical protein